MTQGSNRHREISWILGAILAFSLAMSARRTWHRAAYREEFAVNCDEFGYLYQGKAFRDAWKRGRLWPELAIDHPQMRTMIEALRREPALLPRDWLLAVAPLSYHYEPRSDRVVPQYPPGNGLALGLFPEGDSVSGLNRLSLIVLFALGLSGGIYCLRRRAYAAAGLVAFAAHEGLNLLDRIEDRSFSMNVSLLPLVFATLAAFASRALRDSRRPGPLPEAAAAISGALLGFGLLARVPNVLLLPGLAFWVLAPRGKRPGWKPLAAFVAGWALFGLLPLLIHQRSMTGSPFLSTYAGVDVEGNSGASVITNLHWYFIGSGGKHNWALYAPLVAATAYASRARRAVRELWAFAAMAFGIPLAFFLTHRVYTHYYLWPSLVVCAWAFALSLARLETASSVRPGRAAYLPGIALAIWGISLIPSRPEPPKRRPADVPAELRDPGAWILADRLGPSIWYYAGKASFRLRDASTIGARRAIASEIRRVGGPAFALMNADDEYASRVFLAEIGAKLSPAGQVFGTTYYRVSWR